MTRKNNLAGNVGGWGRAPSEGGAGRAEGAGPRGRRRGPGAVVLRSGDPPGRGRRCQRRLAG